MTRPGNETSEDDMKRRKELKRALHRRLHEELLADKSASEGGYDTDAAFIETPKITGEPDPASVQISPENLTNVLSHLQASPTRGGRDGDASDFRPHTRASKHLTQHPQRDQPDFPPRGSSRIRQASPQPMAALSRHGRSSDEINALPSFESEILRAVIVAGSLPTDYMQETDPKVDAMLQPHPLSGTVTSEQPATAQPAPESHPVEPLGFTGSSTQVNGRLPFGSDQRQSSLTHRLSERTKNAENNMNSANDHIHQPKRKSLTHAIDTAATPTNNNSEDSHEDCDKNSIPNHVPISDLETEERQFSVADVDEASLDVKVGPDVKETSKVLTNENVNHRPVHLYNMRIPELLASRTLLTTGSLPHQGIYHSHERFGSSTSVLSLYPPRSHHQRRTSSSGFNNSVPAESRGHTPRDSTSSSVYPSHNGSPVSSPRNSIICVPTSSRTNDGIENAGPIDVPRPSVTKSGVEVRGFVDTPKRTLNESDRLRRHTFNIASFNSSTDSFRLKELAAAEMRFPTMTGALTTPKASKFTEDFEEPFSRDRDMYPRRHSIGTLDGGYSLGKLSVHGRELSSEAAEGNASIIWERALKTHAQEQANKLLRASEEGMTKQSRESFDSRERAICIDGHQQKMLDTKMESSGNAPGPEVQNLGHPIPSDAASISARPQFKKRQSGNKTTSSIASWTRYPSHDRSERSSSAAGEQDHVASRDFAHEVKPTKVGTEKRMFSGSKQKKSRSMTFPKNIFKSWSRIYKSRSTDFRRFAGGHRSSIATAGILEYPELEMLPRPSPYYRSLEELSFTMSSEPGVKKSSKISESSTEYDEEAASPRAESNANAWSDLYEDCVQYPQDIDQTSNTVAKDTDRDRLASVLRKPEKSKADTPRDLSGYTTSDLRESTLDFQARLQIDEANARERALRAAEEAWGGQSHHLLKSA